jgi:PAS domain S-box-containing protein
VEQIPAITYTAALDDASTTLYISPQIESILGFSPKDYRDDPDIWRKRLHPDDLDRVLLELKQSQISNRPFRSEYRMIARDGQVVWFRDDAVVVIDSTGIPLFLQGAMFDITERKKAEDALSETRNYLENLFNHANAPIIVWDPSFKITRFNHAFEHLTGQIAEEIIGQRLEILFPESSRDSSLSKIERTLVGEYWESVEVPILHKEGDVRIVLWNSANIYANDGKTLIATMAQGTDITERKNAEEDLHRAKEKAEFAMRAKSQFLANMSHEIRTPLNAIIGMTGLLLDMNLNPDQRDCAETVRKSGDMLMALINDILDFSKIEEGKRDLERQPFDLKSCIEGSMDLVAPTAAEKYITLNSAISDQVPKKVVGDVTSLRQVLVNLLGNAVKFTDVGEISVSVDCQPQLDGRILLHFAVMDTGIGIPQDCLGNLFQSFSQVDASLTRKYGGTGLGLAISKKLVELMGGTIWVESEPGIGSTFHFTILAQIALPKQSIRTTEPPHQDSLKADHLDHLRLLLAEDNLVNQKVALMMLKKLGIKADVAANGLEVLEALERQPYEIVIMDIQMPEMDGFEATRAIRERRPNGRPYIIALTAHCLEGDRERCLCAGMDDYISKPMRIEELVKALCRYPSLLDEKS